MIDLDCPHCKDALQIDERFAGTVGKCKHCGGRITVPESTLFPVFPDMDESNGTNTNIILKVLGVSFLGIVAMSLAVLAFNSVSPPANPNGTESTPVGVTGMDSHREAVIEPNIQPNRNNDAARSDDVSVEVFENIKAEIVRRYPNNSSMQEMLIDSQIDSYRNVSSLQAGSVPSNVFENIKADIVRRYPNNYSMQEMLIDSEIAKYRALIR